MRSPGHAGRLVRRRRRRGRASAAGGGARSGGAESLGGRSGRGGSRAASAAEGAARGDGARGGEVRAAARLSDVRWRSERSSTASIEPTQVTSPQASKPAPRAPGKSAAVQFARVGSLPSRQSGSDGGDHDAAVGEDDAADDARARCPGDRYRRCRLRRISLPRADALDDDAVFRSALDPALDRHAIVSRDGCRRAATRRGSQGERQPERSLAPFPSTEHLASRRELQRKAGTRSANAVTRSSMSSRS